MVKEGASFENNALIHTDMKVPALINDLVWNTAFEVAGHAVALHSRNTLQEWEFIVNNA